MKDNFQDSGAHPTQSNSAEMRWRWNLIIVVKTNKHDVDRHISCYCTDRHISCYCTNILAKNKHFYILFWPRVSAFHGLLQKLHIHWSIVKFHDDISLQPAWLPGNVFQIVTLSMKFFFVKLFKWVQKGRGRPFAHAPHTGPGSCVQLWADHIANFSIVPINAKVSRILNLVIFLGP